METPWRCARGKPRGNFLILIKEDKGSFQVFIIDFGQSHELTKELLYYDILNLCECFNSCLDYSFDKTILNLIKWLSDRLSDYRRPVFSLPIIAQFFQDIKTSGLMNDSNNEEAWLKFLMLTKNTVFSEYIDFKELLELAPVRIRSSLLLEWNKEITHLCSLLEYEQPEKYNRLLREHHTCIRSVRDLDLIISHTCDAEHILLFFKAWIKFKLENLSFSEVLRFMDKFCEDDNPSSYPTYQLILKALNIIYLERLANKLNKDCFIGIKAFKVAAAIELCKTKNFNSVTNEQFEAKHKQALKSGDLPLLARYHMYFNHKKTRHEESKEMISLRK